MNKIEIDWETKKPTGRKFRDYNNGNWKVGQKMYPWMMKDKCVTCGVDSVFDFNEHIKFRIGYIIGVGQLCLDCYDKIYFKNKNKEVKSERRKMVGL